MAVFPPRTAGFSIHELLIYPDYELVTKLLVAYGCFITQTAGFSDSWLFHVVSRRGDGGLLPVTLIFCHQLKLRGLLHVEFITW